MTPKEELLAMIDVWILTKGFEGVVGEHIKEICNSEFMKSSGIGGIYLGEFAAKLKFLDFGQMYRVISILDPYYLVNNVVWRIFHCLTVGLIDRQVAEEYINSAIVDRPKKILSIHDVIRICEYSILTDVRHITDEDTSDVTKIFNNFVSNQTKSDGDNYFKMLVQDTYGNPKPWHRQILCLWRIISILENLAPTEPDWFYRLISSFDIDWKYVNHNYRGVK